jgi:hypothetical protein
MDVAAADKFHSFMAHLMTITDQFNDQCFLIGGDF